MSSTNVAVSPSSPPTGAALAKAVETNPALVLINSKAKEGLFKHIQDEIANFKPDTSTAKGRDAIKSFAFKITKTKTAIDAAGKTLTEDARKTMLRTEPFQKYPALIAKMGIEK